MMPGETLEEFNRRIMNTERDMTPTGHSPENFPTEPA
jgi:hypothetical protein|tara:strand:- start:300 stop:410 length:111 start_codon:yes stop_codon:yes gene_type:complete